MNKREFVDYAYKHCDKTVRKYDLEICTNIIIVKIMFHLQDLGVLAR